MKTVLFCGGLGTRIRDYSENIPKPMIPIGGKPILWHLMSYYSQYGHRDFVLCLGYKANVIKEFFLNYRPHIYADCVVSGFGDNIETLGDPQQDWRITMIDTGRLAEHRRAPACRARACRGRGDVPCQLQRRALRRRSAGDDRGLQTKRQGCLFPRSAPLLQPASRRYGCERQGQRASAPTQDADLWINGGFFIFRSQIFDYLRDGEELVEAPFRRLIDADQLLAFKHEGFWRPMDTLKDKEVLEDMVEQGRMPWRLAEPVPAVSARVTMKVG